MVDKYKKQLRKNGFTIIEAMVTIAIIGIMSAVYLTSYRLTNQKIAVDQAMAGLMADLRLAQNMSMNVKKFGTEVPQGGYGINIAVSAPGVYTIYADCDRGYDYDSSSSDCSGTSAETLFERTLPTGVNVVDVDYNDIAFVPPQPIVCFDGDSPVLPITLCSASGLALAIASITLQYGSNTASARTVTINGITGQITAD